MTPELRRIASRVVWWDAPDRVLAREEDFLCRVMALGDLADVNYVEATYGRARLRNALTSASPGVLDARSWHYWHHRLGLGTAGPLPSRQLTGSRESEDFDFFSNEPLDAHSLRTSLPLRLGRVGEPSVCDDTGVLVASMLDLAAQKARVVQVRAERKDYLDLMTLLLEGVSLSSALSAALALYPDFAPLITLKALSYFEDGDLGTLPDAVKQALSEAAAAVQTLTPMALAGDRLQAQHAT